MDVTALINSGFCSFGVPIEYARGVSSVSLTAIAETSVVEQPNSEGEFVRFEMRAYWVKAADLTLGLPVQGDVVTEEVAGTEKEFEVNPPPGSKACYEWTDSAQTVLKVFTKYIGPPGS